MQHGRVQGHCRVGFWNLSQQSREASGQAGTGITSWFPSVTSIKDLPAKAVLTEFVKDAAKLNEAGVKVRPPRRRVNRPRQLDIPDDFIRALRRNRKALAAFEAFSYSHRKEYVAWITGAKRDETRASRVATAVEWLAEGKPRNWKYMSPARHA